MKKLIIDNVPIENVKPYGRNPRKNDEAVNDVCKSISKVGYRTPIIVDENMEILGGHTRLKALKKMSWKEIPYIIQYLDMPEAMKKAYRILDNKTSEKSTWDLDILLKDYENDILKDFGFDFNFGRLENLDMVNSKNQEWVGMPEFEVPEKTLSLNIYFDTTEDREEFITKFNIKIQGKRQSAYITWYPYRDKNDLKSIKYE